MRPKTKAAFRIGEFDVHPDLNRLVSKGRSISVEGKVMAVLLALRERPGAVLSKQVLLDTVWHNQAVAEGVLTRAVHELRHALGDDASAPRYVETVPRRGYRLLVEPQTAGRSNLHRGAGWLAAGLALLGAGYALHRSANDGPIPEMPFETVAVLPFANLTGEPERDYLGDGFAEAVIHAIAQHPEIGVTARTSSFSLRGENLTAEEAGRRLGVDHIVEGSVRQAAGVQRLTIQLIDVRAGIHRGSETLDFAAGDLFAAEQRIAQTMTRMLEQAGATVQRSAVDDAYAPAGQAYDLFLRGRAALHNRSADSLRNARTYFEEAIALDPAFAAPHAGLAQLYVVSRVYLQLDPERGETLALAASDAARALDADNVDALVAAAAVAADRADYVSSIATFERAIELQPSNAQAHQWFGETYLRLGYLEAGRERIVRALQLNPLAGSTNSVRSKAAAFFPDDDTHFPAAKQGEAFGALMAARELALYYHRQGDVQAFKRYLAAYHGVVGVDAEAARWFADAMDNRADTNRLLERVAPLGEPRDNYFAREFAAFGMPQQALDGVRRGFAADGLFLSDIWLPEFKDVRALPGFVDLVRALSYDEVWSQRGRPDPCRPPQVETFCEQVFD